MRPPTGPGRVIIPPKPMTNKVLLVLIGMLAGAALFATGVATGTAFATRHQECDEPDATLMQVHYGAKSISNQ